MTESETSPTTENEQPPRPGNPTRLPWRRDSSERFLGGICAGLARSFDVDPTVVRVATVVLTIVVGGWPALVYLGLWLFLPDEKGESVASGRRIGTSQVTVGILVLALGTLLVLFVLGPLWFVWGSLSRSVGLEFVQAALLLFALATSVGLFLLVRHLLHNVKNAPASTAISRPIRERTPKPVRPKSKLGRIVLSGATLVVGVLWFAESLYGFGLGTFEYLIAVTAVMGIGLVVGAWWGRARWLGLLAVPLALVVVAYANVPSGVTWQGGFGDRFWSPMAMVENPDAPSPQIVDLELGVGNAQVSLVDIALDNPDAQTQVTVNVGVGNLQVHVPANGECSFTIHAHLGAGQFGRAALWFADGSAPGEPAGGMDYFTETGTEINRDYYIEAKEGAGKCHSEVFLSLGLGNLEVNDVEIH